MSRSVVLKSIQKLENLLSEEDGSNKLVGGGPGRQGVMIPIYGRGVVSKPAPFGRGDISYNGYGGCGDGGCGEGGMYIAGGKYVRKMPYTGQCKLCGKYIRAARKNIEECGECRDQHHAYRLANPNRWLTFLQRTVAVNAGQGWSIGYILQDPTARGITVNAYRAGNPPPTFTFAAPAPTAATIRARARRQMKAREVPVYLPNPEANPFFMRKKRSLTAAQQRAILEAVE